MFDRIYKTVPQPYSLLILVSRNVQILEWSYVVVVFLCEFSPKLFLTRDD